MTRVVSIGLDGAAWHRVNELIEDGRMPNMSKLVDSGAKGQLRSVNPPVTCPAWRCSTSGKNPGKLGVFWWLTLDRDTGEFVHPNSQSFDTADIWDYLSDEGLSSAIVNIPMTYPPSKFNGSMVSGFGAPLEEQQEDGIPITHPPDFEEEIREKYDWKVEVDDLTAEDGPKRAYRVIESRFELLLDLLEDDYDYLHMVAFYINMLQHKYGDSEITTTAWEIIDSYLGEIPTEDTLVVIYSDHGHSEIENTFVINRWLKKKGYLSFGGTEDSGVADTSDEGTIRGIIRNIGETAEDMVPGSVANAISPLYRRIVPPESRGSMDVAKNVDWEESKAVATSQGPLYLNRNGLGDEYGEIKQSIKEELSELTYNGEKVLDSVKEGSEVYSGDYLDSAPDLMLTATDNWEIYGGLTDSQFVGQATSWTSGNHPDGMVLLTGDGVETGELSEVSLLDIMPTVLSYMGCAVPDDIDGTVIQDAFEDEIEVDTRDKITKSTDHRKFEDHVKDSLKDLGYLE